MMRPSRSAAELIIGGGRDGPPGSAGGPRGGGALTKSNSLALLNLRGATKPPGLRSVNFARSPRRAGSFMGSSLTRVEFKHAGGPIGLQWEGVIVTRVSDQARAHGIQPGWKIQMIDDKLVTTSEQIWNRLQEARWEWRSSYVSFMTDIRAIRAEQAMLRAEEIKAEAERLAKLPFAGAHDHRHVAQVKEDYKFQAYIDNVEERSIVKADLTNALDWVKDRCHRWRDAAPADRSRTSGHKLELDFMNMHHLYHWLIKPATKEDDCAFAEVLYSRPRAPQWCVMHWWGDRLLDLVTCLDQHIRTRKMEEDVPYWIMACAVRPHSVTDDIDEDITQTCFYKALVAAEFQSLLVLDKRAEHSGPATVFSRAWCGYEALMTLDTVMPRTDVVACQGNKVLCVTYDLTDEEQGLERMEPGSGYRAQDNREKTFSLETIEMALAYQIQSGHTTEMADKTRILECVANPDPNLPTGHNMYTKVNARLACLFALIFWRRGISGGANDSDVQRVQAKLIDAIRFDRARQSLHIDMAWMQQGEEKAKLLLKCVPANVKHLMLDFRGSDITNDNISALAGSLPSDLQSFRLDLSHNARITNNGLEAMAGKLPAKLQNLQVKATNTAVTKEMQDAALTGFTELKDYIVEESQRGVILVSTCLLPTNVKGRMLMTSSRCKAADLPMK